ncbi:hypothetical protein NDN08_004470 [Rhodosorus marinus]|uniref:C2H2-type domain-containing protein n=1 Tax=Rhodosorus marinus TaxID=101924 RepID=A0AAV8UPX9_9RHOD|nr:hypothetical protein NDN08_004470 [Rhodosorus marinus]
MGRRRLNRVYRCDFDGCGRVFPRNYNLQVHRRVHSEQTPFKCTLAGCDRAFRWKSSLQCHTVSHARSMDKRTPEKVVEKPFDEKLLSTESSYALYDVAPEVSELWLGDETERVNNGDGSECIDPLDVGGFEYPVMKLPSAELSDMTGTTSGSMDAWNFLVLDDSHGVGSFQ